MSDADGALTAESDELPVIHREDGGFDVVAKVTPEQLEAARMALAEAGVNVSDSTPDRAASLLGIAASSFPEGTMARQRTAEPDRFLSPRLTVPSNYYTRVEWSNAYYEGDPIVQSLVDRDIDQAIKPIEFQLPEDKEQAKVAKRVLDEWRTALNEDIQQHGGLNEYNKATALELTLSSLIVCIANWGPLEVDGTFLTVGSANLSNRSMGFDAEANLVLEAEGSEGAAGDGAGGSEQPTRSAARSAQVVRVMVLVSGWEFANPTLPECRGK